MLTTAQKRVEMYRRLNATSDRIIDTWVAAIRMRNHEQYIRQERILHSIKDTTRHITGHLNLPEFKEWYDKLITGDRGAFVEYYHESGQHCFPHA